MFESQSLHVSDVMLIHNLLIPTQADIVWESLFVKRSPISEATRGVLTTLNAFGLGAYVKSRDLVSIRRFYNKFGKHGLSGKRGVVDDFTCLSNLSQRFTYPRHLFFSNNLCFQHKELKFLHSWCTKSQAFAMP